MSTTAGGPGKTKWTDPAIKTAFQRPRRRSSPEATAASTRILTTNFANAGDPLFKSPPGCLFLHQASFITGLGAFASKTTSCTDYNFFPFPTITAQYAGAVEGAGDLFGMFHNTPQTAALMKYLVSSQAQTAGRRRRRIPVGQQERHQLSQRHEPAAGRILAGAKSFVFDASDLMPAPMQTAF